MAQPRLSPKKRAQFRPGCNHLLRGDARMIGHDPLGQAAMAAEQRGGHWIPPDARARDRGSKSARDVRLERGAIDGGLAVALRHAHQGRLPVLDLRCDRTCHQGLHKRSCYGSRHGEEHWHGGAERERRGSSPSLDAVGPVHQGRRAAHDLGPRGEATARQRVQQGRCGQRQRIARTSNDWICTRLCCEGARGHLAAEMSGPIPRTLAMSEPRRLVRPTRGNRAASRDPRV